MPSPVIDDLRQGIELVANARCYLTERRPIGDEAIKRRMNAARSCFYCGLAVISGA